MKQAIAVVTGRIIAPPEIKVPASGKRPYLAVTVELKERAWDDVKYKQRIYLQCHSKRNEDIMAQLEQGMLVTAFGFIDAFVCKFDNEVKANLRLFCRNIEPITT